MSAPAARPAPPRPADGSGAMFDRIAPRYDLLNRLISLGLDQGWRKKLVRAVGAAGSPGRVLDVATGTADVALAVARAYPDARVTGLDPSAGMLEVGRRKAAAPVLAGRVDLVPGDAQALPFPASRFDASCVAFGIRNVPDRALGLREMARVTRPGGPVVVLELGEPQSGLLAACARLHVRHVVPTLGAWLSGSSEYRYLASSVAAFPPPEAFADLMRSVGLQDVRWERLSWDAAHLYVGMAPA